MDVYEIRLLVTKQQETAIRHLFGRHGWPCHITKVDEYQKTQQTEAIVPEKGEEMKSGVDQSASNKMTEGSSAGSGPQATEQTGGQWYSQSGSPAASPSTAADESGMFSDSEDGFAPTTKDMHPVVDNIHEKLDQEYATTNVAHTPTGDGRDGVAIDSPIRFTELSPSARLSYSRNELVGICGGSDKDLKELHKMTFSGEGNVETVEVSPHNNDVCEDTLNKAEGQSSPGIKLHLSPSKRFAKNKNDNVEISSVCNSDEILEKSITECPITRKGHKEAKEGILDKDVSPECQAGLSPWKRFTKAKNGVEEKILNSEKFVKEDCPIRPLVQDGTADGINHNGDGNSHGKDENRDDGDENSHNEGETGDENNRDKDDNRQHGDDNRDGDDTSSHGDGAGSLQGKMNNNIALESGRSETPVQPCFVKLDKMFLGDGKRLQNKKIDRPIDNGVTIESESQKSVIKNESSEDSNADECIEVDEDWTPGGKRLKMVNRRQSKRAARNRTGRNTGKRTSITPRHSVVWEKGNQSDTKAAKGPNKEGFPALVYEEEEYFCAQCATKFTDFRSLRLHLVKHKSTDTPATVKVKSQNLFIGVPKTNKIKQTTNEMAPGCRRNSESSEGEVHVASPSKQRVDAEPETTSDHGSVNSRVVEPDEFSCPTCWQVFPTFKAFRIHSMKHKAEGAKTIKRRSGSPMDRPYLCSYCGKSYRHRSVFEAHFRIHTGEKPFACKFCPKAYGSQGELDRHTRQHTGEKPHLCVQCGKRFAESAYLKSHMRQHTGEKPYSCTICDRRFSQRTSLKVHLNKHQVERDKPRVHQQEAQSISVQPVGPLSSFMPVEFPAMSHTAELLAQTWEHPYLLNHSTF